jgi:hypothetical protein
MKKQHLTLTDDDRRELETLLSKGNLKALTFKRATALLELDRGKTLVAVASTLGVTTKAVANWRTRYSSLRLLANKAVESGICDDVSYTFVRDVLKKTNSSRT